MPKTKPSRKTSAASTSTGDQVEPRRSTRIQRSKNADLLVKHVHLGENGKPEPLPVVGPPRTTNTPEQQITVPTMPQKFNKTTIDDQAKPEIKSLEKTAANTRNAEASGGPSTSAKPIAPGISGNNQLAAGRVRVYYIPASCKTIDGCPPFRRFFEGDYPFPKKFELTKSESEAYWYKIFEKKTVEELFGLRPDEKKLFRRADLIQMGISVAESYELNFQDIKRKWFTMLETQHSVLLKKHFTALQLHDDDEDDDDSAST